MLIVKWVVRGKDDQPVEIEEFLAAGREALLDTCQSRLPAMRRKHPAAPPDGFIVLDARAQEVGRRFPSIARHPTLEA
jgi:hypothetical protein